MLVHEILDRATDSYGDAEAVRDSRGSSTYRELADASRACASWLIDQGGRTGDRLVVQGLADRRLCALLYGCSRAGMVFVPVNASTRPYQLSEILADALPALVIWNAPVESAVDRLAPFDEPEIGEIIAGVFADEHITVHTATAVTAVRRTATGYTLTATHRGQSVELRAEQFLVATGRRPATEGLNLVEVGVQVGVRGDVVVDDYLRTTNPRIWAAGDVTGGPQFVYVAGAQGRLVAENALDKADRTVDYQTLPRVTFTSPAIASAGMTDSQAVAAGIACDCRVLPLRHVPRALVNRDTRGLIKLVADRHTGRLLGAHVIADGAGDLIATAVYALANQMTVHQMAEQWCPYLTMAEGLKLAAQTFSRDVTKLSCCAA